MLASVLGIGLAAVAALGGIIFFRGRTGTGDREGALKSSGIGVQQQVATGGQAAAAAGFRVTVADDSQGIPVDIVNCHRETNANALRARHATGSVDKHTVVAGFDQHVIGPDTDAGRDLGDGVCVDIGQGESTVDGNLASLANSFRQDDLVEIGLGRHRNIVSEHRGTPGDAGIGAAGERVLMVGATKACCAAVAIGTWRSGGVELWHADQIEHTLARIGGNHDILGGGGRHANVDVGVADLRCRFLVYLEKVHRASEGEFLALNGGLGPGCGANGVTGQVVQVFAQSHPGRGAIPVHRLEVIDDIHPLLVERCDDALGHDRNGAVSLDHSAISNQGIGMVVHVNDRD